MIIYASDPSMTNFGWCVGKGDSAQGFDIIDGGCIKTRSNASENGVTKTEDQTRRMRYMCKEIEDQFDEYEPNLVACEYQPGYTSSKTAKCSGMVNSMVISSAYFLGDLPVEWYQPGAVKKIILGKKSGTKEEIRNHLEEDYPNLSSFYGGTKYQTEAVGDAAAVLECAVNKSELVKVILTTGA